MKGSTSQSDTLTFTTRRELLNPKFEGYKLDAESSNVSPRSFALPEAIDFAQLPQDHSQLSYHQVQHRAKHNHLYPGQDADALYIEPYGRVIAVDLSKVNTIASETIFHHVLSLARLAHRKEDTSSSRRSEYPTAVAISTSKWILSDGEGVLYCMTIDKSVAPWRGRIDSTHALGSGEGGGRSDTFRPFQCHSVSSSVRPDQLLALLTAPRKRSMESAGPATSLTTSSVESGPQGGSTHRHKLASNTVFEYIGVEIDLLSRDATPGEPTILTPLWRGEGDDLPQMSFFDSTSQRCAIISSGPISSNMFDTSLPAVHSPLNSTVIARSLASAADLARDVELVPATSRPYPFSWSQESDSVTVAFAIPSDTPTSNIRIVFTRQFLTLHLVTPKEALPGGELNSSTSRFEFPHISHKELWDLIDPHLSVWTFDRDAEGRDSSLGLLTLHLEKSHVGTRWSDVFASSAPADQPILAAGGGSTQTPQLENVPETLDPSELAQIVESMEQWHKGCTELNSGGRGAVYDSGTGYSVPTSLTGEEIDVEIDADVGRPFVITWVEAFNSKPRFLHPHSSIPFGLLSTELPQVDAQSVGEQVPRGRLTSIQAFQPVSSIVIKHDVDGALFVPPMSGETDSLAWKHVGTFPAMSFVLATKKDAGLIYHFGNRAMLAFDCPSRPSSGCSLSSICQNLFVYERPAAEHNTVGRQLVIPLGGYSSGSVLGIAGADYDCATNTVSASTRIIVLCEKELLVLETSLH